MSEQDLLASIARGLAALHREYSQLLASLWASTAANSETCLLLAQFSQLRLQRIEQALERERQGSYGSCLRCRRPIRERLVVLPFAELCADCQSSRENGTMHCH